MSKTVPQQLELPFGAPALAESPPMAASSLPTPVVAQRRLLDPPRTLAGVWEALSVGSKPTKQVQDMRAAIRTVGRVVGRPLDSIPAGPAKLRSILADSAPQLANVTDRRWSVVRSLTLKALGTVGYPVLPGRDTKGLSPQWRALHNQLDGPRLRNGLSKLLSFLSRQGVDPSDVTPEHLEAYREALLEQSLVKDAARRYLDTLRLWDLAAAAVPAWPAVVLAREPDPRRYSLSWKAFPESFREDVARFLQFSVSRDPFSRDYARSVSASTRKQREKSLRAIASALVQTGFPAEAVTSLRVLVDSTNAEAALRYLLARSGRELSDHVANQADLLRKVARFWLKDEAAGSVLKVFASQLREEKRGMTEKNRERMRQFNSQANVEALLNVPARIIRDAQRNRRGDRREAVRVAYAVAIELLTVGAIRRRNLTALETRHFVEVRRGRDSQLHLVVPPDETKTKVPIEVALCPETRAHLKVYLEVYRPRLVKESSPYLFPGWADAKRSEESFAALLSKFIFRETGLRLNVHAFRHLVGKLYLDHDPQGIETVRQILGHTTTKTTLRAYAEITNEHAFRRYDELLSQRRSATQAWGARR